MNKTVARRAMLKNLILQGMPVEDIAKIKIQGQLVWKRDRTLRLDISHIHTQWLLADTKWFTRAHVSRIQYEKQLEVQLNRVNRWRATNDANMETNEKIALEKLITYLQKELHETKKEIDPDMYLKELTTADIKQEIAVENQ